VDIIKVHFIFFSLMLICLPYSYAETETETETETATQMLAELVDVVVTEIEEVVEVKPLKTKSREVDFIADDEFSEFMYQYPGLIVIPDKNQSRGARDLLQCGDRG
jgi:Zn/Cd-binding protein ZinT